ncbi:MAG: aminopeptidase P family protein [Leptospiraceae bacterium]|nr:aminopeptidase P family protein [Leptospiraceae bacterium]
MAKEYYTGEQLNHFRSTQRMAYDSVRAAASRLKEGMTEREAADLIDQEIKKRGCDRYFHGPFAWFGERSGFLNIERPLDFRSFPSNLLPPHFGTEFLPSSARLEKGMCVILDVAPIQNNASADVGYAFAFDENPAIEKALDDLEVFRPMILDGIRKEKTMAEIYHQVDDTLHEMGYLSSHSKYPFGVLGHKVGFINTQTFPRIPFMNFELSTFAYILGQQYKELVSFGHDKTPLWSADSRVAAEPGLWAVEPHICTSSFGVKWEEIIHVTDNNAEYIDNDLPHVNRWAERRRQTA